MNDDLAHTRLGGNNVYLPEQFRTASLMTGKSGDKTVTHLTHYAYKATLYEIMTPTNQLRNSYGMEGGSNTYLKSRLHRTSEVKSKGNAQWHLELHKKNLFCC